MGNCLSRGKEAQRSAAIDEQLKRDRKKAQSEVKLLLLGAGESGKSTVLRQMKMIHSGGYSVEERQEFTEIVFSNVVNSMKTILGAMDSKEVKLEMSYNRKHKEIVEKAPMQFGQAFPQDLAAAVKSLWEDNGVQKMFQRSNEFQLLDSAEYFFNAIDRIADKNYVPTEQDVLRSRAKSTGIVEIAFNVNDLVYRVFDVGGQRTERKKWIHSFDNVTAILFLVAISEYDQVLREDEKVNRMNEALALFKSICNSRWFVKTSIILFMNKIDIFRKKIRTVPISRYFPDYDGGSDYEEGCRYFIRKFLALNESETKRIYPHLTCATDTGQIKFVMGAVHDIIVRDMLDYANLL